MARTAIARMDARPRMVRYGGRNVSAPTARQLELLRAIHARTEALGRAPTYRELLEDLQVTSLNSIVCLMRPALRAGWLTRDTRTARSFRLTPAGLRAIGAPCCGCAECRCGCHHGPPLPKRAATILRNLRAGPADGETRDLAAKRFATERGVGAAVLREREECALLMEKLATDQQWRDGSRIVDGDDAAKAIRSRGGQ